MHKSAKDPFHECTESGTIDRNRGGTMITGAHNLTLRSGELFSEDKGGGRGLWFSVNHVDFSGFESIRVAESEVSRPFGCLRSSTMHSLFMVWCLSSSAGGKRRINAP